MASYGVTRRGRTGGNSSDFDLLISPLVPLTRKRLDERPFFHRSRHRFTTASHSSPHPLFRGDLLRRGHVLGARRQSVFRSKRLTRAKRIARSNMPPDADRMELVEINRAQFDDHREAYRQGSGRSTDLLR